MKNFNDGLCPQCQPGDQQATKNENRTLIVIVLTAVTMVAEILAGRLTSSMALLADGYHMGSHFAALLITYLVYRLSRMEKVRNRFTFGQGKMLAMGGFISALLLGLVAGFMIYESIDRFFNPEVILFGDAILVAVIGLTVNLVSAVALFDRHHHLSRENSDSENGRAHHHDHNIRGAYFHVLADALTSILAIAALVLGKSMGWSQLDPAVGILGGLVIIRWAYTLVKNSGYELLDGHAGHVSLDELFEEAKQSKDEIVDLHVWKNSSNSTACELIIKSKDKGALSKYRQILTDRLKIDHTVIEVRPV